MYQHCPCSVIVVSGKARNTEETVLSDSFTGSARKRELPEREKQFAPYAAEGSHSRRVLMLQALRCI